MDIRIISTLQELLQYSSMWEKLLDNNENDIPYMEMEWIAAWWTKLSGSKELYVLTFLRDGEVLGFFPFMKSKRLFFTEIEFIGQPEASYMDLLIVPQEREAVISKFAEILQNDPRGYIYNLHTFPTKSKNYNILLKFLDNSGTRCYTRIIQCPYIESYKLNFDSYYNKKRKHSSIRKIKSIENKISSLGELKYVKGEDIQRDASFIDSIFQLHKKRWQKKIDTSNFAEGQNKELFKALALNKLNRIQTVVNFLMLNNRVVAFEYGFVTKNTYTLYRCTHDDDFSAFALGKVMVKESIKNALENGVREYNFGTGYERYKLEWADQEGSLKKIILAKGSVYGRILFKYYSTKDKLIQQLKQQQAIINFKRNTLGKIKYGLSLTHVKSAFKRVRCNLNNSTLSIKFIKKIKDVIKPIFSSEKYAIFNIKSTGNLEYACDITCTITQASVENIEELSNFMNCSPEKIVEDLYKKNKCVIVNSDGKLAACMWYSESWDDKSVEEYFRKAGERVLFIKEFYINRKIESKGIQYLCIRNVCSEFSENGVTICIRKQHINIKPQYFIKTKSFFKSKKLSVEGRKNLT